MTLASGANPSSLPVTRSSNRAPSVISRSVSCIVVMAVKLPCMPGMPSASGWLSGKPPLQLRVVTTGMSHSSASSRSASAARALRMPPPA